MKINYASDLHLEYFSDGKDACHYLGLPRHGDVLVLAGDICAIRDIKNFRYFFEQVSSKFGHVVYVPGNHEYWNSGYESIDDADYAMMAYFADEFSNIHYLSDEVVNINGVDFVGSTLWPKTTSIRADKLTGLHLFPDLRMVEARPGKLQSPETLNWLHERSVKFLKNECDDAVLNGNRKFFVTHFAPTWNHTDTKFAKSPYNHFFYNSLDDWFVKFGTADHENIKAWVWGHMHKTVEASMAKAKVGCNPRGYFNQNEITFENEFFSWNKHVNIGK